MTDTTASTPHRLWPSILGGFVLALAVLILILVLIWNWDWFRPMVERKASAELGRPVTLTRFNIDHIFSGTPDIEAYGISIANPPGFPQGSQFGHVDLLDVKLSLWPALRSWGKTLIIPEITIDHPTGDLRSGPKGNPNWTFVLPSGSSGKPPQIGGLIINNGDFLVSAPKYKANLHILAHTEQPNNKIEAKLIASATGTYAGAPITAQFVGGAILSLRDRTKPYPIDFRAQDGQTRMTLIGTVRNPMKFAGADLTLTLRGADLADLYQILGIPVVHTAPYHLRGRLDYDVGATTFKFVDFAGVVGSSDLEGNFYVTLRKPRPLIRADLSSHSVNMEDLAGFIGAAPGKSTAGASAAVKEEHAEEARSSNLLPDIPISMPKIRAADFDVTYRGMHFINKNVPLDNIYTVITIRSGLVNVHPLNFGVGSGTIASNIKLNARTGKSVHLDANIDFRHVDFHRLMQSTKFVKGTGTIGGYAALTGNGDSLAQIMSDGNGRLKLFMTGGNVSALIVDLVGLDFGRSILALLGLPEKTSVQCMITDFSLTNGIINTNAMLFDTGEADIIGKGWLNLRNETINLRITQQAKHFSILAFHSPIEITGMLKMPSVKVEAVPLLERAGAAVALGVLLPAIGALIPTIQLGLGPKNDCVTLVENAKASPTSVTKLKEK